MAYWLGRESFHAGGFVVGGKTWGILGGRGSGKSTTVARLALAGAPGRRRRPAGRSRTDRVRRPASSRSSSRRRASGSGSARGWASSARASVGASHSTPCGGDDARRLDLSRLGRACRDGRGAGIGAARATDTRPRDQCARLASRRCCSSSLRCPRGSSGGRRDGAHATTPSSVFSRRSAERPRVSEPDRLREQ